MKNALFDTAILLQNGEINKDKINLVAGAITKPLAEMVWLTTGGDMETVNRLTNILVSMNTPPTGASCSKSSNCFTGLWACRFPKAEPMGADPDVLDYFIFSFTADFAEIMQ